VEKYIAHTFVVYQMTCSEVFSPVDRLFIANDPKHVEIKLQIFHYIFIQEFHKKKSFYYIKLHMYEQLIHSYETGPFLNVSLVRESAFSNYVTKV
jgi:hypothetical protein